jgi:phosphoribosylformylglycinamidine cyclo-ligase
MLGDATAAALPSEDATATLGDVLLRPTRIHAPVVLALREALDGAGRGLVGVAHVTGGGLPGNLPRAIPDPLGVLIDPEAWSMPVEMRLIAALARIADEEVRATFNGGIGMACVVDPAALAPALAWLDAAGVTAWPIGRVEVASGGRRYREGRA